MGDVRGRKHQSKRKRARRSRVRIKRGRLSGSTINIEKGMPFIMAIIGDRGDPNNNYCTLKVDLGWTNGAIALALSDNSPAGVYEIDASEVTSIFGRCTKRKKSGKRKVAPSKTTGNKRAMSPAQLAALAKGRAARAASLAARS